jgi:hypothetical protein
MHIGEHMSRKKLGAILIVLGVFLAGIVLLAGSQKGQEPGRVLSLLLATALLVIGSVSAFTKFSFTRWLETLKAWLVRIQNWANKISNKKGFDLFIYCFFAIYALICTLGRWNGISPFIFLGIDAAYLSSYAAALDHPAYFLNDYFLSNPGRVSSYFEILIPILRFLKTLTGDYGGAFLMMLPLTIFLKLFGFYFLGKRLFSNRWLALLLAIVTFPIVYSGGWDYWGIRGDALPRSLYEIFFPWIILGTLKWIDLPKKWYLLSFFVGLTVYVHAISAAVLFPALLLAYLFCAQAAFWKRAGQLVVSTLIFLMVISPFLYFFFSAHGSGTTIPVSYSERIGIINVIYGETHLQNIQVFGKVIVQLIASGILPLAVLALLYFLVVQKRGERKDLRVIGAWLGGLLVVCVLLPELERLADPWLKMITVQMMLIRGLRYVPPLLLVFSLLAFFRDAKNDSKNQGVLEKWFLGFLVLGCLALIIVRNPQDPYFTQEIKCLSTGHWVCPTQKELDAVDVIQALDDHTQVSDTVLFIPPSNVDFSTAIRFQALRNMGYSNPDMTRLSLNPGLQIIIASKLELWESIELADQNDALSAYLSLAEDMQTDYLIVSLENFPEESLAMLDPVYENSYYALVQVQ